VLYDLSHSPSPFALVIFQVGSHIFVQAGIDHNPSIYISCQAGITDVSHCAWPR
jgi:hypothetical protein